MFGFSRLVAEEGDNPGANFAQVESFDSSQPFAPSHPSKMSVSAEEVAKHNKDTDCWVIVGDQVLDVTNFLADHPGGKKSIMMFAGKDATEEFDMLHDRKVIKKYGIDEGTVAWTRMTQP